MHAQRGGALVEFALVASIVMVFLFGILEFGELLYSYHAVANAARLGARYAAVHGSACSDTTVCPISPSPLASYVASVSPGLSGNLTVTPTWTSTPSTWYRNVSNCSSTNQAPGCLVTVTVTYSFPFTVPFTITTPISSSSETVIMQ